MATATASVRENGAKSRCAKIGAWASGATQADKLKARSKGRTSFFEKKEAKKLLLFWAWGVGVDTAHNPASKSFLVLFFKKELLP
jgi:hypothetical protein